MTAHSGAPELPIAKGASGGELSRVMLALEVVLTDADPVATLVFDEVDAGVGGRAATEIGSPARAAGPQPSGHRGDPPRAGGGLRRPSCRGRRRVAAARSDAPTSGWSPVSRREVELARMLGGTNGSSARAHARDLLAAAVTAPSKRRKAG